MKNMPENEQSNLKQRNLLGLCSDIHRERTEQPENEYMNYEKHA